MDSPKPLSSVTSLVFAVLASVGLMAVGVSTAQGSLAVGGVDRPTDAGPEVSASAKRSSTRSVEPRGNPQVSVRFSGEQVRLVVEADRVVGVHRRSVTEVRVRRQGAVFRLTHVGGKRWATRWRPSIGLLASLQGRLVATVFLFTSGARYVTKSRVPGPAPDSGEPPEEPAVPAPDTPPTTSPNQPSTPTPPEGVRATGLVPDWSPTISDYTVSCAESVSVTINVDGEVSMDGGTPRLGQVTEELDLDPGEAFRLSGDFGEQVFRCRPSNLPLPTVNGQGSGSYFLVTPTGFGSSLSNYAMVLDRNGVPLWWYDAPLPAINDFNMPRPGIFSWVQSRGGNGTFASSAYIIQSVTGEFVDIVRPVGFGADNHDLQPTPDGGWLLIGYVPRNCPAVPSECVDLSPWGGPANATVIDGWIQKVDANGNPIWTWKSQDHIDLSENGPWIPSLGGGVTLPDGRQAYDIVHMNSVEPDGNGFIFSARHLDAVYRVEDPGGAGGIDWKLGGTTTPESLTVFGDPRGSDPLGGQHDARRLSDGTVTIHDNGSRRSRPPRMVRYRIDPVAGTADLVSELSDTRVTSSICCGGGRVLPDGNGWAVSWGASSLMGEYGLDGQPRLRMTWPGGKISYRIVPVSPSVLTAAMLRDGMDAQFPRTP